MSDIEQAVGCIDAALHSRLAAILRNAAEDIIACRAKIRRPFEFFAGHNDWRVFQTEVGSHGPGRTRHEDSYGRKCRMFAHVDLSNWRRRRALGRRLNNSRFKP